MTSRPVSPMAGRSFFDEKFCATRVQAAFISCLENRPRTQAKEWRSTVALTRSTSTSSIEETSKVQSRSNCSSWGFMTGRRSLLCRSIAMPDHEPQGAGPPGHGQQHSLDNGEKAQDDKRLQPAIEDLDRREQQVRRLAADCRGGQRMG